MKYTAEQQVSFEHFLSVMKGALLRLRPFTSAFVEMREKTHFFRKVLHEKPLGRRTKNRANARGTSKKHFDFGSILHLRTFAFIIVGTVLLVVYINNLLTINELSRENEGLRESIGISKSVNAALELELQEIYAIDNILLKAEAMGLKAHMTPAVTIGGE